MQVATKPTFQVGSKVIVHSKWTHDLTYRIATVTKVYKTGHIILDTHGTMRFRVDKWEPNRAVETGDGYYRIRVELATPEAIAACDARIAAQDATRQRKEKTRQIIDKLSHYHGLSNEQLDQILDMFPKETV